MTSCFDLLSRDTNVRNAFDACPDKMIFVYGRDGIVDVPVKNAKGEIETYTSRFGTHGFVHRNWYETVGYFVPPYFVSDFNDTWFNDVFQSINRRVFLPNVYTEHMHFLTGKSQKDKNTEERLERHRLTNVEKLYYSPEMDLKRKEDARKVTALIANHAKKAVSPMNKSIDVPAAIVVEPKSDKRAFFTTRDDGQRCTPVKIGSIGVGKLGLPVCIALGMYGHDVLGYDMQNSSRIQT